MPEIIERTGYSRSAINRALVGVPRVLTVDRFPQFTRRRPYWALTMHGGASEVVLGRKFCPGCGRWRHVVDFPLQGGVLFRCGACARAFKRHSWQTAAPDRRADRLEAVRFYRVGHGGGTPRTTIGPRSPFLPRAPLVAELDRLNGDLANVCARAGVTERTVFRLRHEPGTLVRLDVADRLALAMGIPLAVIYREDR